MRRLICHKDYRHKTCLSFNNRRIFIEHLLNLIYWRCDPLKTMLVVYCMLFIRKYEAFIIKMDDYKDLRNIKSHWLLFTLDIFKKLVVFHIFSTIWIFHVLNLNIWPFWALAWLLKIWKPISFILNNLSNSFESGAANEEE